MQEAWTHAGSAGREGTATGAFMSRGCPAKEYGKESTCLAWRGMPCHVPWGHGASCWCHGKFLNGAPLSPAVWGLASLAVPAVAEAVLPTWAAC